MAYLINGLLLHPGDSLEVKGVGRCEIMALPIAAPWLRLVDALMYGRSLAPRTVIPIHDAIIKDFMLERIYAMAKTTLEKYGIAFQPLAPGETTQTQH